MAAGSARVVARFDGWTLSRSPLELSGVAGPVRLQEQPLQILEALVGKPGELVRREELIARLWPDSVVDYDAGLNTAVRKLRAALGDDPDAPRYLETVPRQGYRFIGTLEPAGMPLDVDRGPGPLPPAESPDLAPTTPATLATRRRPVGRGAALAFIGLVAAGALIVVANRHRAGEPPRAGASTRATSRLAVLPFENLSPDPANAFFADGMHSELLGALGGRQGALEVISRTTMLSYRDTPRPVQAVARDLGATHVLEASVRRDASSLGLSVRLIDAALDRQIWSNSYQRTVADAMTLPAQIAQEVAAQLAIHLPETRGASPPPRNPEAYDHWLRGVLAWQQVGGGGATGREIDRVEAMFTRAIELDDRYAAAYADRARVRIARVVNRGDASEANVAGAREDIARAQQYAGASPHVRVRAAALAFLVDRDLPRALALIEEAERVAPLDADLLMTKGNFVMFDGRFEESLGVQAQAARLDPGNAAIYRFWVSNYMAARRPADALRVLRDFDARYPGRLNRGEYLFAFTGATAEWWSEVARLRAGGDVNATLSAEYDLLRYEGRLADLRERLATAADADFPQHSPFVGRLGASLKPVAELRGWERLLAGDRAGAARDGRTLGAAVERLPRAVWNEWWRRLLGAEVAVLVGDHRRAIELARSAAGQVRGRSTIGESVHIRLMAARVLAWSGAHDDAVGLLEDLARGYPGAGPATIVRDPFFTTPLAAHQGWRRLARTLEAEIAANQVLLTTVAADASPSPDNR